MSKTNIKRYTHSDGFEGECAGAMYVEIDGDKATVVFPEGRRMKVPTFDVSQIPVFVANGWWVELTEKPTK